MKMVIFGGGSSYTPELVDGLIRNWEVFPVRELCLQDINVLRLDIMRVLCGLMLRRSVLPVCVTATTERERALEGAAFVNAVIRVGGMDARIQDEKIPPKYGIIGQETTGPGGMMKALRTIPVMLSLAHDMERLCPEAWLINYTNPSGIMAEALGRYSKVHFVGLCSGPKGWIEAVLRLMGVEASHACVEWVGLNHLGFLTRLWVDGQERTTDAIEAVAGHWNLDADLIRTLGVIPATYLATYYHHDRLVAEAKQPGYKTRGEQVKGIETELFRLYADPNVDEKPELLRQRGGGGYAEVAFAVMLAIRYNKGERHIVQVLNQGAVDGISADASVEVASVVDAAGAHPICVGSLPLAVRGLVQAVKAYETLTVEAAVTGSRRVALQALLAHPLVGRWEVAHPLLEELLATNRQWIPWA